MSRRDRRRSGEAETLGTVLEGMLAGRPWAAGVALGELGRRWAEVVGERLATEATPASLEAGVLLVRASSAGWAAQLSFLSGQLRDRANEVLGPGSVREVKVVLDRGPASR